MVILNTVKLAININHNRSQCSWWNPRHQIAGRELQVGSDTSSHLGQACGWRLRFDPADMSISLIAKVGKGICIESQTEMRI